MPEAKPLNEINIEMPVEQTAPVQPSAQFESFSNDRERLEAPAYERQQEKKEDVIMHFSDDLSVPTYIRRHDGLNL
jgi:hypothetical protein